MRSKRRRWPWAILLALGGASGAQAQVVDTVCSNPARAGVKSQVTFSVPPGGVDELHGAMEVFAKRSGMSTWEVNFEDPGNPRSRSDTLGLQSPKVSVSIEAEIRANSRLARAVVKRTCINDDLEPWEPYWEQFRAFLRERGYLRK